VILVIIEIMTSDCMDILIQFELEVFLIERALHDVFQSEVSHDFMAE
jgi:hypothetical protein